MRAPVRKSLRKWAVGVGCTLTVALALQQAKSAMGAQAVPASGGESSTLDQPSASDDQTFQEWHNSRTGRSHSRDRIPQPPDDSFGYGFGFDGSGSNSGSHSGSDFGSGFRSRSGHS